MESPAVHPRPPWMDEEEHATTCTRLAEIDTLLRGMGATKEYCREYFQSGGGVCEHTVGGKCKRHRMTPTPLPKGKMCLLEFGQRATELRQQVFSHHACPWFLCLTNDSAQVSEVEAKRHCLRREWEQLKENQTADQFLVGAGRGQVRQTGRGGLFGFELS